MRPRPKLTSPLLPSGLEIIVPPPPFEACSFVDKLLVYASSLTVVGSPLWFYGGMIYLYRKWKRYRALASLSKEGNDTAVNDIIKDENYTSSGESSQERPDNLQRYDRYKRLASKYGTALAMLLIVSIWGPHRYQRVGEWLDVRKWRLWDAWLNYIGFTVLQDRGDNDMQDNANSLKSHPEFDMKTSPAIFAFVPHGIFPFGLVSFILLNNCFHVYHVPHLIL